MQPTRRHGRSHTATPSAAPRQRGFRGGPNRNTASPATLPQLQAPTATAGGQPERHPQLRHQLWARSQGRSAHPQWQTHKKHGDTPAPAPPPEPSPEPRPAPAQTDHRAGSHERASGAGPRGRDERRLRAGGRASSAAALSLLLGRSACVSALAGALTLLPATRWELEVALVLGVPFVAGPHSPV